MAQENFANFATSTLTTPLTSSGTLLSVTTGDGLLFPSANFYVTIDTEILYIATRSTDTLTIGGRGVDYSSPQSHVVGATVQLCLIAYNMNHLWNNVADTSNPDVPPLQLSGLPSAYDNEFEQAGNWQLYPSGGLPSGATFAIGSPVRSHLLMDRGSSDNTLYTAYVPFTPVGAFTVTCKISDSVDVIRDVTQSVEAHFWVSDQTNPTSSADSGTRIRLDLITYSAYDTSGNFLQTNRRLRVLRDINNIATQFSDLFYFPLAQTLWLRLTYDNNGNWGCFVGDGYTFSRVSTISGMAFTPQSLGFTFYAGANGGQTVFHTCLIDYVRCTIGNIQPCYMPF